MQPPLSPTNAHVFIQAQLTFFGLPAINPPPAPWPNCPITIGELLIYTSLTHTHVRVLLITYPQHVQAAISEFGTGKGQYNIDRYRERLLLKEGPSAFAEVAEIKFIVTQLILQGFSITSANPSLVNYLLSLLENGSSGNNNGQMVSRKRSANFELVRPEAVCRPALPNGVSNYLQQWPSTQWANILNHQATQRTSPTIQGGAAPVANGEVTVIETNKQWGSPDSDDSVKADNHDATIDPVGDGSDGSSSTSSTCTQAMMSSPPLPMQPSFNGSTDSFNGSTAMLALLTQTQQFNQLPRMNGMVDMKPVLADIKPVIGTLHNGSMQAERKPRKQISDDYVKLIRQHDMSGKSVSDIQIPVPEAIQCDPTFQAVSEQQIVQQIVQSKKFDEMDAKEVQDATTQLCKKLAEKRVFGPKLMAQTTVAGPNHSTYNNLPDEGIIYIQHVCRQVLKDKVQCEEEFWDVFREAMRKLAARCRRVRHAKKQKVAKENGLPIPANAGHDALSILHQSSLWQDVSRNGLVGINGIKEEVTSPTEAMDTTSPPTEITLELLNGSRVSSGSPPEKESTTIISNGPSNAPIHDGLINEELLEARNSKILKRGTPMHLTPNFVH